MNDLFNEIVRYIQHNWEWLVPWFFAGISLIVVLFKKGSVDKGDIAKIIATEKVIASALSVLLDKENKEYEKKKKSAEKREEVPPR